MKIQIANILPHPDQPRKHLDQNYIQGLAYSIQAEGLKDPITVEDCGDGQYILVKGQCRILACQLLGLTEIEAVVRPLTNHQGQQRLIDAVIENVARENMNAVDEGNAYKTMKETMGMSVREISIKVGRGEPRIYAMLAIASLELPIQEYIAAGRLPQDKDAVTALLAIPNADDRLKLAAKLAEHGATIKMVTRACFHYQQIKREAREKKRISRPALDIAGLDEKPTEWDALYQLNRVPPWQKFTESVMKTCDSCSLRPVASEATCRDCPLVAFCKNIMEATQ